MCFRGLNFRTLEQPPDAAALYSADAAPQNYMFYAALHSAYKKGELYDITRLQTVNYSQRYFK